MYPPAFPEKRFTQLLVLCLLFAWQVSVARADTVIFKNLQQMVGEVVEDTPLDILLKVEYGTIRIEKEKILKIQKETEDELKERKKAEEAEKVVEEKMRADGKVFYLGEWITKEEKDKKVAQKEAARLKLLEEKLKKQEQERKAKEQALEKERQAAKKAQEEERRRIEKEEREAQREELNRRRNEDGLNPENDRNRRTNDNRLNKFIEDVRKKYSTQDGR